MLSNIVSPLQSATPTKGTRSLAVRCRMMMREVRSSRKNTTEENTAAVIYTTIARSGKGDDPSNLGIRKITSSDTIKEIRVSAAKIISRFR